MKKRIIPCLILAALLLCPAGALGQSATAVDNAYHLYNLGLFQGGGSGFELDRQPTRLEGLTMLIRLLGKEDAAKSQNLPHGFSDVPTWGSCYAGYAYANGIAKGNSPMEFGATEYLTAEQYLTFVLRALGYSDAAGDFEWEQSLEKAAAIGLLQSSQVNAYQGAVFLRGDLADVSWAAMNQTRKDAARTLGQQLIAEGVITRQSAVQEGLRAEELSLETPPPSMAPTYTPAPEVTPASDTTPAPESTPQAEDSACLHETSQKAYDGGAVYTPANESSHQMTRTYRQVCSICGQTLLDGVQESDVQAHQFEGDRCALCGYTKPKQEELVIADGLYQFVLAQNGKLMNVYGGLDKNGTAVGVWDRDGTPEQVFRLQHIGGGKYRIYAMSSSGGNGKVVDINRGSNGAPLRNNLSADIWDADDAPAQEWYLKHWGNGQYQIILAAVENSALGCRDYGTNGGRVRLEAWEGMEWQKWELRSTQAPQARRAYVTTSPGIPLNLRSDASLSAAVIGSLQSGQQVEVEGNAINGFYKVHADGKTGFASRDWIGDAQPQQQPSGSGGSTGYVNGNSSGIEAAINWAQSRAGQKIYQGLCAKFVGDAFRAGGIGNRGYATAKQAGDALITHTDANPPRGAAVFYNWTDPKDGVNYGHIGISLGDGRVVHADYNGVKVTGIYIDSSRHYRGWGEWK